MSLTLSDPSSPPKKRRKISAKALAARHRGLDSSLDRMTLLAHQLRSPLSVISALAQGIARRGHRMDPQEVKDRGRTIWLASRRLDELITTIMNFARANAGGIIAWRTAFDIKSVIQRVSKDQERLAGTRRCSVDIGGLPDTVIGDPALIEQALVIIVANALRYSPQESVVTIAGSSCRNAFTISIKDKGIGIMAQDLPFVGQPFFRGANARHLPGTGLGLSLARHIITLHGGRMSIQSREGEGTIISIELPRHKDERTVAQPPD